MTKLKCMIFALLASITILSGCAPLIKDNAANAAAATSDVVNSKVSTTALTKKQDFTENDAIAMVLKALTKGPPFGRPSVDFPNKSGQIKNVEALIGGKAGTKTKLELSTNVEKQVNGTFIVTLKKDWKMKIGNKEAVSYWKYAVNQKGRVKLVTSDDNDNLIAIIK